MINELEQQIDAILNETVPTNKPHANHLIADKVIYPKSAHFGQKGSSYMLYNGGEENWYFLPKGEKPERDNFIRVKWYFLDSNVSEGSYGKAKYVGINPTIRDVVGTLSYTNKKWNFVVDTDEGEEKYTLVNPDSVRLIDA